MGGWGRGISVFHNGYEFSNNTEGEYVNKYKSKCKFIGYERVKGQLVMGAMSLCWRENNFKFLVLFISDTHVRVCTCMYVYVCVCVCVCVRVNTNNPIIGCFILIHFSQRLKNKYILCTCLVNINSLSDLKEEQIFGARLTGVLITKIT